MSKKQFLFLLVMVAACNLIGGVISSRVLAPKIATAAREGKEYEKVVKASKYVLLDKNGKVRALLQMEEGSPVLSLYDENGKDRAAFQYEGLFFIDENEKGSALLNEMGLILIDSEGKCRVSLLTELGFTLGDKNGQHRAAVNELGLLVFDEKGKVIFQAP